jgi:hypothetical protein
MKKELRRGLAGSGGNREIESDWGGDDEQGGHIAPLDDFIGRGEGSMVTSPSMMVGMRRRCSYRLRARISSPLLPVDMERMRSKAWRSAKL